MHLLAFLQGYMVHLVNVVCGKGNGCAVGCLDFQIQFFSVPPSPILAGSCAAFAARNSAGRTHAPAGSSEAGALRRTFECCDTPCLQDIELMKSLGIRNFRMSLAWPRLFPNGTGKINQVT